MHYNITIESIFHFCLICDHIIYLQPQLHYRIYMAFDYSIVYVIIAPAKWQDSLNPLIRYSVNDFTDSSRMYNGLPIVRKTNNSLDSYRK